MAVNANITANYISLMSMGNFLRNDTAAGTINRSSADFKSAVSWHIKKRLMRLASCFETFQEILLQNAQKVDEFHKFLYSYS